MVKPAAIKIAQGQMSDIEVFHTPRRLLRAIAGHSLAKKSQFEAKLASFGRTQVPCVIPPFGRKFRMIEVIARELVAVSRQRRAVLRRQYSQAHEQAQPKHVGPAAHHAAWKLKWHVKSCARGWDQTKNPGEIPGLLASSLTEVIC